MALNGLIIAAPSSGAGKTMITLGLLRALRGRGVEVSSAKSGPDYIDPAFHKAASGCDCVNLDAWAMQPAQLRALAHGQHGDLLLVEGAMGLFDAAPEAGNPFGKGSVADLAAVLDLPVVLVVDAARQGQTAAAVVAGLAGFRDDVQVSAVLLNNIGSLRHSKLISQAIEAIGLPVIGSIPRTEFLHRPSRHLGLVQAIEDPGLEAFINQAAGIVSANTDLDRLADLARPVTAAPPVAVLPPLGQRIAIARDHAFAFAYPHLLDGWRCAGAELSFFSPLNDTAPDTDADSVYLPGGYPELHAGQLAQNEIFRTGVKTAAAAGKQIYAECGGYMTLGDSLTDSNGNSHRMLGLLPVSTSFAKRKMTLGYRNLTALTGPWAGRQFKAHEFHYATISARQDQNRLFSSTNSMGENLGEIGHCLNNVSGSFAHLIA